MLQVKSMDVHLSGSAILTGIDFELPKGEVAAILGPSGCGKSTLLRTIAGLVAPSSGNVLWDGGSVLDVPTHQRQFGLMFQGYALFPHMTVAENVGFGLRMGGHESIDSHVADALTSVGLGGFERRRIETLSGGERQRVALARTLAPRPRLVMLDEPLGALDRNLRAELLAETSRLLAGEQTTAIVVTHDRDEAVAMSDWLAVMRAGRIVQTGTVDEILEDPADNWVHDFIS